jgi:hypothetical protein
VLDLMARAGWEYDYGQQSTVNGQR